MEAATTQSPGAGWRAPPRGAGEAGGTGLWPRLVRAGMVATGWGAVCAAIFFALSIASLRTDGAAELAAVRDGFAAGSIDRQVGWIEGDTRIGAHQWNDCLILYQAVDRRAPARLLALSPLAPTLFGTQPCPYLDALAQGRITEVPTDYYHRYLHGHTVLARLLLARLSVGGIRLLYSGLIALVLMFGVLRALIDLSRRERRDEAAFWLVVLLVLARWYGLESFGQSLGHGPADLVLVGFVAFLARCSSRGGLDVRRVPAVAAVFGALTIIFEFLTGGIPLGLAVLIGGLPFAIRPLRAERGETPGRVIGEALVAFAAAIATVLAIKTVLVVQAFGPAVITTTAEQLLFRMGVASAPAFGTDFGTRFADLVPNLVGALGALAPGERLMTICMLCISAGLGGWAAWHMAFYGDSQLRERALALAASNLPLYLWFLAFWQHSVQHARFMDRIMAWTIASGLALHLLAVMNGFGLPGRVQGRAPDRVG